MNTSLELRYQSTHIVGAIEIEDAFARCSVPTIYQSVADWDYSFRPPIATNDEKEYFNFPDNQWETTQYIKPFNKRSWPEFYPKNTRAIAESFDKELKRKEVRELVPLASDAISKLAPLFAELPFEQIAIEIANNSRSIKLSLLFQNDILLIVSKPLSTIDDVSEDEIIYSVFTKNKLIASDVAEKHFFLKGFSRFLSM